MINDSISLMIYITKYNSVYTQGKKLWTIKLPGNITTMEVMENKNKGFKAVLVALTNCEVHMYRDKYLVNVMKTEDVVTAMRFGRFGREEQTLIMTTRGK